MKSESFLALCRQHVADTFKAQKGCKNIDKIIHVISVLQPYEATRILSVPVNCPECVSTDTELYTFFNKRIFVFFVHKSYSCSFIKLRLNQWCYVEYFINFLTSFLGLGCGSCVALHTALRFPQILNCVPKLNEVLWVGNKVRVNNWWLNFHFFRWTVHLRLVLLFFVCWIRKIRRITPLLTASWLD